VWLLGLNAQSWPRKSSDDPLLPEHIVGFRLRGTTLSNDDRRSHDAILASTEKVVVRSLSRRDATGRKLGVSPLVEGEVEDVLRTRVPEHAMSEPDRLLARPSEFADSPGARLAAECWHAWLTPKIGAHDGLVASEHPALLRALARTQSATSLALLLRNPLGFMWRYALGMQAPEMDENPVELDHLAFGNLVHEVLERAVTLMEAGNEGFGLADCAQVEATVSQAVAEIAAEWDATKPIPPQLLWEMTQRRALTIVVNALTHPFPVLAGQRSFAEVPFGSDKPVESAAALPWDPLAPVNVPGTEFRVGGRVDRLDLSDDASAARVVDYKSGRKHGDFVLRGGRELQRCIYAYVVGALLDGAKDVEAGLLYPSQAEGGASGNAYAPLENPAASLKTLAMALAEAAGNMRAGLALPGPAAGLRYRDTRSRKDNTQGEDDPYGFALPVVPGTMLEPKKKAAAARLGHMPQFWETP
jgi:RecB family exonuclease